MEINITKHYSQKWFKLALSVVLVLLTLLLSGIDIVEDFENRLLDYRFRHWIGAAEVDSNIVIVSIDDFSLDYFAENGISWPWPRSFYGHIVEYLSKAGADAVIFDMLFSHADADRSFTDATETDSLFAESMLGNNNSVLGMMLLNHDPRLSYAVIPASDTLVLIPHMLQSDSLLELPIEVLMSAASGIGHTNIYPDQDGIFRYNKPIIKHDNALIPSLATAAYLILHPEAKTDFSGRHIHLGDLDIPVNKSGDQLINWYGGAGPSGVFPYIAFKAVIQSASAVKQGFTPAIDPTAFKNKIVIIGADASGLRDLKATPILQNGLHPGMEVWATVLSNYLKDDFINNFPEGLLFMILVGMGYVVLLSFDRLQARRAYAILIAQLLLYTVIAFLLWIQDPRILLPATPAVIISLLAYLLVFSNEMRERIFLKRVFGPYIAPELMSMMYQTREAPSLGGEQVNATAFFSDLQGFTKFSEKLSPVKLVSLLNEYLTDMTDSLMGLRGTLDKYEGDAIIAFFGAPVVDSDHAHQAVKAAIVMQRGLATLRTKWESEGEHWPEEIKDLQMRIGINSGEMLVGNVGSKGRMNFTMMGDTVNVAARLESSAKQYGVLTHISEATARQMPPEIILRRLGATQLVGKENAAVSYEVLGYAQDLSESDHELLKLWPKALHEIEERNWDAAETIFRKTLDLEREYKGRPTNPSLVYLETRLPRWRAENPGAGWIPIWVFDTK